MANVVRANREFDQRAVFGLGEDNQAEDVFNAADDDFRIQDPFDGERFTSSVYGDDEVYIGDATFIVGNTANGTATFTGAEGNIDYSTAGYFRNTLNAQVNDPNDAYSDLYGIIVEAVVDTGPAVTTFGTGTAIYSVLHITGEGVGDFAGTGHLSQAVVESNVTGAVSNATGLQGSVNIESGSTTTVNSAFGGRFSIFNGASGATIQNAYALYVDSINDSSPGGAITGLHIEDMTIQLAAGVNIRSAGSGSLNHFEGKLLLGGELELDGALNHDGSTAGFYGTAPIAKQTGVAVDAAAIHAALVALGLIGA